MAYALPELYDALYAFKDYAGEAAQLTELVRGLRPLLSSEAPCLARARLPRPGLPWPMRRVLDAVRPSGTTSPRCAASRSPSRSAATSRRRCARAGRGATSSRLPIPTYESAGCPIYAAYVAGVGVNAIFPARAGDVVRLTMAHRAIRGSTYTTLVSSSIVLAIVDVACAIALFAWALTQGVLPSLDVLPSLPSFDFAWFLDARSVAEILLVALVFGAIAVAVWVRVQRRRRSESGSDRRSPSSARRLRWLRTVVTWQLADWALRLTTIWFMLDAFRIEQSARNVLLVQATQSLATLVPISPGGIGTEQAFLVYTLARPGVTLGAPGLQRRHEAHAHRRQRRRRLRRDPAHAAHAALPRRCPARLPSANSP